MKKFIDILCDKIRSDTKNIEVDRFHLKCESISVYIGSGFWFYEVVYPMKRKFSLLEKFKFHRAFRRLVDNLLSKEIK